MSYPGKTMTDQEIFASAARTWELESRSVARLPDATDREAFCRAVRVMGDCAGRIVTSGCGTSAAAARKIAHSLNCIERPSFFLCPGDAPHGGLGAVREGDVVILISKGGNTSELASLIPSIRQKKAFIIGVTENPGSAVGAGSDLVLKIRVDCEADEFNMLATASTMAVIAVFDAICVALMGYTEYTREQFAVIHPHGAVGERLLKAEKQDAGRDSKHGENESCSI